MSEQTQGRLTPFLKQVARVYTENEPDTLGNMCFIFPNKRSAQFFRSYIREAIPPEAFSPATKTISSFVEECASARPAGRLESLFVLYDEYRRLAEDVADFDQFVFWGEMLLGDIDDVDRYLVDSEGIFTNVRRYKEINSTYLTPEQIAIIERFWGEIPPGADVDTFWTHVNNSKAADSGRKKKTSEKFIKLWEVLYPLYKAYHSSLARRGKMAPGMTYRIAAEKIKATAADSLPYSRYVFVGFNVLTPVEIKIFATLRDRGKADFYWDFNSPAFSDGFNRAGRFIGRNIKEFESRYPLPEKPLESFPDIEIIGVPGGAAQVKTAGNILREMARTGLIADTSNAIDTAVVLPDESLFLPLSRSLPYDVVSHVNVTMGTPLRHTPASSIMRIVSLMQHRMRFTKGTAAFFYEDVLALIGNAMVRSLAPAEADNLENTIAAERLFRVGTEKAAECAPTLAPFFKALPESSSPEQVMDYIAGVLDLTAGLSDENSAKFAKAYLEKARIVVEYCREFGVSVRKSTIFRMVERTVSSQKVNIKGDPLRGLQVMGVLETRALDFDNIVMLSMNERVFPRRHFSGSFIPEALRRGFGMSTGDFQESIFAYYFYRLLSRARHVKLIYDACTIGVRSGAMSRYLTQLLYLYADKSDIRHTVRVFNPTPTQGDSVLIHKDEKIISRLRAYIKGSKEHRSLSPSAINTYISCPLQFYLRHVEGYDPNDELKDYIDHSVYGTVLHAVAQDMYKPGQNVTGEYIDGLLKTTDTRIGRSVARAMNRIYNRLPEEKLDTPLLGEALVMGKVIKESISTMLRYDRELTPFEFVDAEKKIDSTIDIAPGMSINFRGVIDRIDRVDGRLRIVDYKTGDESASVEDLSRCFDPNIDKRPKGLMQILLYSCVYGEEAGNAVGTEPAITPVIYNFRKINESGPLPAKVNKKKVDDHTAVRDEFMQLLSQKVSEIFNPDIPFVQSSHDFSCKYCNFKTLCGRK